MRAILAAIAVLAGSTAAHATSRADVRDDAQAIITQTTCTHPADVARLAYLQTRKGVSVVQMTTALPYVAYPTEADIAALASRALTPRTTNGRLLAEGEAWLESALATLTDAGVC